MKVRFALERDADGWPPAETEGLWAEELEKGLYRLDNTPWFVCGVAADDLVEARPDADGVLLFSRAVRRGGRIIVRAIPRGDGPLSGDRQALIQAFESLGVGADGASSEQ